MEKINNIKTEEKVILKWKTSDGKCTHKKNNHRHNGNLNECIPKHCPYLAMCELIEEVDESVKESKAKDIKG